MQTAALFNGLLVAGGLSGFWKLIPHGGGLEDEGRLQGGDGKEDEQLNKILKLGGQIRTTRSAYHQYLAEGSVGDLVVGRCLWRHSVVWRALKETLRIHLISALVPQRSGQSLWRPSLP